MNGEIEINEPVRVYDTSGPWGDPDFHGDVTQGLPPLRAKWIRERGDVEEIKGRAVNADWTMGISQKHADMRSAATELQIAEIKLQSNFKPRTCNLNFGARRPLRASPAVSGHATVLCATGNHHARDGIHRHSRESGERTRLAMRQSATRSNASATARNDLTPSARRRTLSVQISQTKSLLNSCAPKSRAAAPSFPPTSIIPNPSR